LCRKKEAPVYVLFVSLEVKPERLEEYLKTTINLDGKGSVGDEPGCYRFDVLQDNTDPNKVYFYEVYKDRAAFEAHTKAPHYLKWAETVKGWTTGEATVVFASSHFPSDGDWQKQPVRK
jgi:(4S)-4-hydroxy-5-phosphonooxypentane-2,3-dione isomerase